MLLRRIDRYLHPLSAQRQEGTLRSRRRRRSSICPRYLVVTSGIVSPSVAHRHRRACRPHRANCCCTIWMRRVLFLRVFFFAVLCCVGFEYQGIQVMGLSYGVIMVIFLGALVPAVANRNFQHQSKER